MNPALLDAQSRQKCAARCLKILGVAHLLPVLWLTVLLPGWPILFLFVPPPIALRALFVTLLYCSLILIYPVLGVLLNDGASWCLLVGLVVCGFESLLVALGNCYIYVIRPVGLSAADIDLAAFAIDILMVTTFLSLINAFRPSVWRILKTNV
jgi:hypothetical protein